MSEHMAVVGKCEFYHLPYCRTGSFSYCHWCKKNKLRLRVEFHQGICNDWIKVVCTDCDKAIWTAELTSDKEDYPKADGGRNIVENDRRCSVCKKPTNRWDCDSEILFKGKSMIICSEKCDRIYEKMEDKNG